MRVLILLIIGLAVFFVFSYIYSIAPRTGRRRECEEFIRWMYAHRGLWSEEKKIPENSLPAFARAVESGYAIELDVQLTKDNHLVVFHDDTLTRMCGKEGKTSAYTLAELKQLRLKDTDCEIPEFREVLELVDGKVPLLIEIKLPTHNTRTCMILNRELKNYQGKYCIESFNSLALRWFKRHRPGIVRGQLSDRFRKSDGVNLVLRFLAARLMLNWVGRPDFIAYNYRHANKLGLRLQRMLFGVPLFAWTVQNQPDWKKCRHTFDTVIFDGFLPEKEFNRGNYSAS